MIASSLPRRLMCTSLLCLSTIAASVAPGAAPRLQVDVSQRFLVREDGQPFFYLGDTAWELLHRLNLEEARHYLDDRAAKGFTVIQAVALAELRGLTIPNANGHLPLIDLDPARPAVHPGPNNDYWDHVDAIIDEANRRGLVVGLLPTWGDKWNLKWGEGPVVFTPQNAGVFGEWIGRRYRDKDIIWIVGGDRNPENEEHLEINHAMARGIRRGDGGARLITFHPQGGQGSSEWFHEADWLDFNMRQNGHVTGFHSFAGTGRDYALTPAKPVLDGEPLYEDHPIHFNARENGHSGAADVRRPLYWNLFQGAFGHTYGHHSVWQMWAPGRPPINAPLMPWQEALHAPGAGQMQYGRYLLESRPMLSRIPDDTLIVPEEPATSVPGAGRYRFVATRDREGSYAMIYAPIGRPFRVRTDALIGPTLTGWWYNPRNGTSIRLGNLPKEPVMTFLSPNPGEDVDWVLVLDDAEKGYAPPGRAAGNGRDER
jgi:hypothetical protein